MEHIRIDIVDDNDNVVASSENSANYFEELNEEFGGEVSPERVTRKVVSWLIMKLDGAPLGTQGLMKKAINEYKS